MTTTSSSTYGIQSITYNPRSASGAPSAVTSDPQAQEMSFLQLLIAQISNQTPDSPMDPTAMITQYSQMEASIGLIRLNNATQTYQNSAIASALMGQEVKIKVDDGTELGSTVSGKVEGVDFSGDRPMLSVGGMSYPVDSVVHVGQ